MTLIVDYGVGNIASLVNMFDHIGVVATASSDPAEIAAADRVILPGVGAYDMAMQTLTDRKLVDPIMTAAASGANILGVCLGMQLLARGSEEGALPGLGLIAGDVVRLTPGVSLKVPHVGWAEIDTPRASPIFPADTGGERFYFVHSFHLRCDDPADIAGTIEYGAPVTVAISRRAIHGVQFHPEKSHRSGMRLLRSFAETRRDSR